MSQLETDIKNNAYKRVWQMAASLSDENGLAMPEDLMFKNFEGLDKEILKWKVGYEKSIQQKEQINELKKHVSHDIDCRVHDETGGICNCEVNGCDDY